MIAYWMCAAFTFASACVSLGYAVVAVRGGSADRSSAEYALARSLALAVVSVVPLFGEWRGWLHAAAVAMSLAQAADAIIGARDRDRLKTIGPAATAAINLGLLIWMTAS